jgi:hypothetical protein
VTQFYAYYHLAAEPYPPFDGRPGYPVDVEIPAPVAQNRLTVLFRGILLLPALVVFTALAGAPLGSARFNGRANYAINFGPLHVFAFLGWFASVAWARMPRGLRDGVVYSLSYGAQFWSYAFLLTERYPDSDPIAAVPDLPDRSDPVHLELSDELRRSRLTVFFRLLLTLPHLIWLALWAILAVVCAILNWFATLFAGSSPRPLHRFLAAFVRYELHVLSYLYLLANPFPGFVGAEGSYPYEIVIAERARQNRWKTGFRLILAVPALLLASAYGGLAYVVAVLGWFSSLARGRMPRGLRNAGALAFRYHAQTSGYLLLLTDAYPCSGPVQGDAQRGQRAAREPAGAAPDVGLS